MTNDQFESILRPLAEEFAQKIAAAVSQQLQARVAHAVKAVMEQAFNGALPAAHVRAAAAVAAPGKAATKPASAATNACSQPGCGKSWYRPAGKDRKLCYAHFIAAGGKAPPGKKRGTKNGKKR